MPSMRKLPDALRFLQSRSPTFPASANITAVEDADKTLVLFDAGGSGEENHLATVAGARRDHGRR